MKRPDLVLLVALALLLLASLGFFAWAWQTAAKRDAVRFRNEMIDKMMRQKEQAAQSIQQGIAAADYRTIETGIARLRDLAVAADWYAAEASYRQHSDEFRQTLEELAQSAREQDLEATRQSYADLRVTCANCHALNRRP
jgi:HAMP domain-containing protein